MQRAIHRDAGLQPVRRSAGRIFGPVFKSDRWEETWKFIEKRRADKRLTLAHGA